MLEELFQKYLPYLIHTFELMGIIVLSLGAFSAFYHYFLTKIRKDNYNVKYEFANVMVTALDFKLAGEILKTVIVRSKEELLMLGAVFLLRIIMTFVLEREIKMEENAENKNE